MKIFSPILKHKHSQIMLFIDISKAEAAVKSLEHKNYISFHRNFKFLQEKRS